MARHSERSNLSLQVTARAPSTGLRSIRSWLGKQAAIGGRAYVERIVKSDAFAERFLNDLDGGTRMKALTSVAAILAKAPLKPKLLPPSADGRVKIRWSDEMVAKFKALGPRIRNNRELAKAMGLPPFCASAMKRARTRYLKQAPATVSSRPVRAMATQALPLAA